MERGRWGVGRLPRGVFVFFGEFSDVAGAVVLLKVLNETVELSQYFVGPIRDVFEFVRVELALILSHVELAPDLPG